MPEINLLPQELKPKSYAVKLSKTLKRYATLTLVLFFAFFAVTVIANIILATQNNSLKKKNEELSRSVEALQSTEKKLVLVEDRLQKIGKVLAQNTAREEVESVKTVVDKNASNVYISGAKIDQDKAVIEVQGLTSADLTGFFTQLASANFKKVDLVSFSYQSEKGYKLNIGIVN